MRGCRAGADGCGRGGCLRDDGGRECQGGVCGHCKVSRKAFRVDCPHQEVCCMDVRDADDGSVLTEWMPMNDGDKGCFGSIQLDGNASTRRFRVDCPHQEVCGMDIHTAGGDGGRPRWMPVESGGKEHWREVNGDGNVTNRAY